MRPGRALAAFEPPDVVRVRAGVSLLLREEAATIARMAKLSIRVDLGPSGAVGPGKIRLLESVDATGSISAAGRSMNMSYRRAWLLIDDLNHLFRHPVVATRLGGAAGGGARLTAFGKRLVRHYRDMESEAHATLRRHLNAFQAALTKKQSRRVTRRGTTETDSE
jgi:molybdate transport system regulatory protein